MWLREDIRKTLSAQRHDLFRQAAQTEGKLRRFQGEVETEAEEGGQKETLVRLLDRLDERAKAEIAASNEALARIDSSQYRRCQACGQDIPEPRLEAFPTAALCLACAQAGENQTR